MSIISVIVPVLNEGDNIHHLLDSLLSQMIPPDEIVVVDGGSTDNTIAVLESYARMLPLRIIQQDGTNISMARNIAIAAATGDIICATDAGLRVDTGWVASLVAPLMENSEQQVVAGFFWPDAHTTFELANGACVGRCVDEIDAQKFLPGSRSIAFRKSAWMAAGRYPEWLDFGEDLLFVLRLKKLYPDFAFVPNAVVYFRPRSTFTAFYKQYYLYARGDGKADFWRKRHIIRYLTYLILVPALLLLSLLWSPVALTGLLLGAGVYLRLPYRRFMVMSRGYPIWQRLYAALLIPCVRVTGDIAKMQGYIAGWRWRLQHYETVIRPEMQKVVTH